MGWMLEFDSKRDAEQAKSLLQALANVRGGGNTTVRMTPGRGLSISTPPPPPPAVSSPPGKEMLFNYTARFFEDGSWTVPEGVTRAWILAIGGGGGGGRSGTREQVYLGQDDGTLEFGAGGGSGGSSGGSVLALFRVTPGQQIDVVVGTGGTGDPPGPGTRTEVVDASTGINMLIAGRGEPGNGGGISYSYMGIGLVGGTVGGEATFQQENENALIVFPHGYFANDDPRLEMYMAGPGPGSPGTTGGLAGGEPADGYGGIGGITWFRESNAYNMYGKGGNGGQGPDKTPGQNGNDGYVLIWYPG